MKYPPRHFGDIRDIPEGSHQEMGYYRAWLDRYAGLKRHIEEIDTKDLCGGDHEILNRHDEFKDLVDADRAAENIELTLYAKWMKPSTKITARIKMGHPDIAKLFSVLMTLAEKKRAQMWGLYGEAVDAFCKTTLGHFGTEAPIDINSYRELEEAFENFGETIGESNAKLAFEELKSKYVAFTDDVAAAEADGADLFYEECDHEEKKDLEEIIGNVECSNKDLEDLEEELRGYTNGYDVFIDWHADRRDFYNRIDPDGVAMSYTLMGLQWYHMWARSVGPCVLTDLLGMNKMLLESFIDRLSMLFPDIKQLCFKANKSIDLYTNFVHDADQFKLDRSAADYQRQLKLDSILEALRNVAYAIKESEDSFMKQDKPKTFIVTAPRKVNGGWQTDFYDGDTGLGVYSDLMDDCEHQALVEAEARKLAKSDEKDAARHLEAMKEQKKQTALLEKLLALHSDSLCEIKSNGGDELDFYSFIEKLNADSMKTLQSNLESMFGDELSKEEISKHIQYAKGEPMDGLTPENEAMYYTWEHVRTYVLFKQLVLSLQQNRAVSIADAYDAVITSGPKDDNGYKMITRNDHLAGMTNFARYKLFSEDAVNSLTFIFSNLYLMRAKCFRAALQSGKPGNFLKRILAQFKDLFSDLCCEIRALTSGDPSVAKLEDALNDLIAKEQVFFFATDLNNVRGDVVKKYIASRHEVQALLIHIGHLLCQTDFSKSADITHASKKSAPVMFVWNEKLENRWAELKNKVESMDDANPEVDICYIAFCALDYFHRIIDWYPYLRGESVKRPADFQCGDGQVRNVGEWMKGTIVPCILNPLKSLIEHLPTLNKADREYPLKDLESMFAYLGALIGLMNHCEEELKSREGSDLGLALKYTYELKLLVCPNECRPGHVILETKLIKDAFKNFYKSWCNAAWALAEKVSKRDSDEIDLSGTMEELTSSETREAVDEAVRKRAGEDEHNVKMAAGEHGSFREMLKETIQNTPVTVGGLTKEGEKAVRKASQRKPGKPANGSRVFSRPKIAKMFGVSAQAVYYWDRGKNAPAGYCEDMRLNGDIEGLIKCLDARNSLKDFLDVLNTKNIVRDGFNEEEVAAINGVLQDMLRRKRNGENILATIEGL